MFELFYVSQTNFFKNNDQLEKLLEQSRENNLKKSITGILVYHDGWFMQLLEGQKLDVLNLMETIERDERHFSVHVIFTNDITKRSFSDWSMAYCDLNSPHIQSIEGFPSFLNSELKVSSDHVGQEAHKQGLLNQLKKKFNRS